MKELICLGIESTSHTFSVGLVNSSGKIIANENSMLVPKIGHGFVPNEMFDHHIQMANEILSKTLEKTKLDLNGISCIAFSQGMGIPNSLRVGASAARYLAMKYDKPLIGVNHAVAHVEIGKLTAGAKDPVIVYLSGGNTQIIAYDEGVYRVFGETLDIPVGNALDVLARAIGLEMPGGPEIERIAHGDYVELPYIVKGMDLSFSGVMTEAAKKIKDGLPKEDIAYSFQETCFSMLTEVTERALAHTGKDEVLLVGGVAANKRLQRMMSIMCKGRGAKFLVVRSDYSGDNGSMIAWTGLKLYVKGYRMKNSGILQKWRIDEVILPKGFL